MLASFVMWAPSDDEVLLACSADLLQPTLKRLSMFVLRAKCKLSDASAELPLWGVAGVAPAAAAVALALPEAMVDDNAVPRWLCAGAEPTGLPALDAAAWDWLEVRSGVPRIVAATVEQFVPQMVNLELVGGVDFRKGCYPGQEVVARSQYRGTLKRRAYLLQADAPLTPGQEIFHSADPDQPAGMVALAASWCGEHVALAELKIAAVDASRLADGGGLRAGVTPVCVAALPYSLPSEAP